MRDFIVGAFPFVIIGLCLAIILANIKDAKNTYCSVGMCLGLGLGQMLYYAFDLNMGLSFSLGILIGEAIGILIKKK